jgi:hypothetical protein
MTLPRSIAATTDQHAQALRLNFAELQEAKPANAQSGCKVGVNQFKLGERLAIA